MTAAGGRGRAWAAALLAASALIWVPGRDAVAGREEDAWVRSLRGDLPPLRIPVPGGAPKTPAVDAYLGRYGLDLPGVRHGFGAVQAGGFDIATHLYLPPGARGSVLLVHGYLDHSGLLGHLIRRCVAEGYAVLAFDLPGHGLSSGARGGIDRFASYGRVLGDLLGQLAPRLPGPLHAVGHSTGCAALYEHLRSADADPYGRLVYLAPLVRSAYWHLSRAGQALAGPFLDSVPRSYRENSSDPGFLARVRGDPLGIREVPLAWVRAHQAWYDRVLAEPVPARALLVVQGTADDVVDWEFNLEFLRARFSPVREVLVTDARHQLINERPELRDVVLDHVVRYLLGHEGP